MSGGDDFDLDAMERRRQRAQQRTESLRDERRGNQRSRMRRSHRRRRAAALGVIAVVVCVAAGAWTSLGGAGQPRVSLGHRPAAVIPKVGIPKKPKSSNHIAMPKIVRGIHVSLAIAGSPARMNQFFDLTTKGLNTLEIDVKDENGQVGFVAGAPALARKIGATRNYYNARQLIREAHAAGIYVIGRIVCFEDPILSQAEPQHAIRTTSGGVWTNASGLGWTNEYDPFVWNYLKSLSIDAAKMGFDEIQYDYVRFPTDGNVSDAVWPHKVNESYNNTIYRFLKDMRAAIKPLGVNISANVFGLSAHENLHIGQDPTKIGPLLDAISPMAYPSHYSSGEYNLTNPDSEPGATVTFTMGDFRAALSGSSKTIIRPWLQDFSLGHTYTLADVVAQTTAAERGGAGGWLLWNADDVYHTGALGD
ncbi:MAG: putative glycoside hydrolase [Gaiellales bacterium]